ncbi:PEP-CTERM sorting domain-containing protein [Iodidimonas sp. SYSU 1G8]|uniref:PEP-CTERM sorting domain-containing protein n=1 Tax=Iodidimonas sp. SYSU 1G8 TaxID=3133967 RepID=UPI0031FF3CBB
MKSRDILASVILIGAAILVAASIFISPATQTEKDFEIYGWLFENQKASEADSEAKAAPVRVYDTPKALGDELWSILMPKDAPARFSGTGGSLSLLQVSTGTFLGGSEGNALLTSPEFQAAADGAVSGTDEGIAALLRFFDAAGGNETIIAYRAQVLLEAITRDSAVTGSLTALQEATTNISEAAFTALWTGYVMPVNFQPDFAVPPGAIGYDLGPLMLSNNEINPVYDDFIRVPADSSHVEGDARDIESGPQLLWGDGVQGLTVFTAPIPNGTYKVFVMTSSEGGVDPSVAFGDYNTLKREKPVRRIDLRQRHDALEQWRDAQCGCGAGPADMARFLTDEQRALPEAERQTLLEQIWQRRGCGARDQVRLENPVFSPDQATAGQAVSNTSVEGAASCRMRHPDGVLPVAEVLMSRQGMSPEIEPELSTVSLGSDKTGGLGSVYALREEVKNGTLFIDFNQGYIPSYVVGIIVVAIDDSFSAQMSAMVSAVLETVHPAVGAGGQGPGLATNFAATTLPTGTPGGSGSGTGGSGTPGSGLPGTEASAGDGDGDGGDGDGTGGDGDGDGTGGDGDGTGGDGDGTAQLVAEGLGPYTGVFGDELTLDGTQSTFNGELILSAIDNPADLLVEWLFDLDGDGSYETLISNDLVALIDSSVFGSTGEFQGILRLTLNGLVSIDQVIVILIGEGTAVPEPGIGLLLLLALGLLVYLHRRRRARGAL